MKIYVLLTKSETSSIVSGIYSSKNALIADLSTTYQGETLDKVEIWEVDRGFVDYLPIKKQVSITIED